MEDLVPALHERGSELGDETLRPTAHLGTTERMRERDSHGGSLRARRGYHPSMSAPSVSVVIPTFRREARLAFTLDALARQSLDPDEFEVLVVRAPGEPVPESAFAPRKPVTRSVEAPDRGAAAQRNHGWRQARAPLVAFTDDDCRPSPDWLARLLDASRNGTTVVQGRTEPDPDELHLLTGLARTMQVTGADPWHPSCNIAYPKPLLAALGGFDEAFDAAWGEDSDLGLTAGETGAEFVYAPDALVWHAVHARSLPAAVREARRREWIPLVVARHPAQRRVLYRRWFVNASHATLAGALLGAVLLRRRSSVIVAFAPYLLLNIEANIEGGTRSPRGFARLMLYLPERLCVDLVELCATLGGAVKHRTLVI
jgi:GT2 family glycosyltransferase